MLDSLRSNRELIMSIVPYKINPTPLYILLFMLVMVLAGMGCKVPNYVKSIEAYEIHMNNDKPFMQAANAAMKEANEVRTLDKDVEITRDKVIPALKQSEQHLKTLTVPDKKLQEIHEMIIDYRIRIREALEEYVQTENREVYFKKEEEAQLLYNQYIAALTKYYKQYGYEIEPEHSEKVH